MSVKIYSPLHNPLADVHRADAWDYAEYAPGLTVPEMLPGCDVVVRSEGALIPAELLPRVRWKEGVVLYVRPLAAKSIGSELLEVASIAALVAASFVAGPWMYALYAVAFAASRGSAYLARSKLDYPGSQAFTQLNALTGSQNQVASYEPIPRVLGRMRYYPPIPMTALPYTEVAGDDQWLRYKLLLGYGPLEIGGHIVGDAYARIDHTTGLADVDNQKPIQIGGTDIHQFDAQWQIGGASQVNLYTNEVIASDPGWVSDHPFTGGGQFADSDSAVRTTAPGATEFAVVFTGTLFSLGDRDNYLDASTEWVISYRLTGTSAWTTRAVAFDNARPTTVMRAFYFGDLANDGTQTYDVQVARTLTWYWGNASSGQAKITWSALNSYLPNSAFALPGMVVMDLRVRRTDQINGTVQQLSVLATSVLNVYDGTSWALAATRAPAWAFASVLTDAANYDPVPLSSLYAPSFLAWANATEADGVYYDAVLDSDANTLHRLADIAQCGYAMWSVDTDTVIRAVLDTPNATPRDVITPRNSWGYQVTVSAFNPPDALRVRYTDSGTWQPSERLVFWDGYSKANAVVYQSIDAPGCTSARQAWIHGRRYLANMRLRATEQHTFQRNYAHFDYGVGDVVHIAYDTILVGIAWGRVKSVTLDADNNVTAIDVDEYLDMDGTGPFGLEVQHSDGTVSTFAITGTSGTSVNPVTAAAGLAAAGDLCVMGVVGKITTPVLVTSIQPQSQEVATITCQPAAPKVLDAATGPIPAPADDVTAPVIRNVAPPTPTILQVVSDITVAQRGDDGSYIYRIFVRVAFSSGDSLVDSVQVRYREAATGAPTPPTDPAWHTLSFAYDAPIYITDVADGGVYDLEIRGVGNGNRSAATTRSVTVVGDHSAPPDVTGLAAKFEPFAVTLSWLAPDVINITGYLVEQETAATWSQVATLNATQLKIAVLPTDGAASKTYNFRVKAKNNTGLRSSDWADVAVTVNAPSAPPVNFSFAGPDVVLVWNRPGSEFPVAEYVVRRAGVIVDSLRTTTYRARVDWGDSLTWSVAAVDNAGNEGPQASVSIDVLAPTVTQNAPQVIGDNVLLYWGGTPGSLPIDHYDISEGATFATAKKVGRTAGTFSALTETKGGTHTYWVVAVDTAGNKSAGSGRTLQTTTPDDFQIHNDFIEDFDGTSEATSATFTNGATDEGSLIAAVNTTETWAEHFTANSWATPQDQIDAGYPIYAGPGEASGTLVWEYDTGVVVPGCSIRVSYTSVAKQGTPTLSLDIATRELATDDWDTHADTANVFASDFQYVQITLHVSGGIVAIASMETLVAVQIVRDRGKVAVGANPTHVDFAKSFLDISALTASAIDGSKTAVVIDFDDTPDPTGFDLYTYAIGTGAAQAAEVAWQAEGV